MGGVAVSRIEDDIPPKNPLPVWRPSSDFLEMKDKLWNELQFHECERWVKWMYDVQWMNESMVEWMYDMYYLQTTNIGMTLNVGITHNESMMSN